MNDVYMACEWVIRPAVNYVRLVGIAHELGCTLSLVQAHVVTPEKLVMMRFALHAPDSAAFEAFHAKTSSIPGLDDWQPAPQAYFEAGQVLDFRALDTTFLQQWMEAMHAYGIHNQALLDAGEES